MRRDNVCVFRVLERARRCDTEISRGALETKLKYVPYARTNTDVIMAMTTELVTPNSAATCSEAGAIMEDEMGDMKVKHDTVRMRCHFLLYFQLHAQMIRVAQWVSLILLDAGGKIRTHFFGFSGSLGPSQSTMWMARPSSARAVLDGGSGRSLASPSTSSFSTGLSPVRVAAGVSGTDVPRTAGLVALASGRVCDINLKRVQYA